jgi:peptidoglycan/LPS O-acetylase OafA/YrhL
MVDQYAELDKHIAAGAGFISNLVLWGESGYFDKATVTKPLLNLWSLGVEEQYYIVWPMVLWIFFRWQCSIFYLIITALFISFVWNHLLIKVDLTATFYAPWTRFWELLIGSSLAYMQSKTLSNPPQSLALLQISWLGFTLCMISFWQIDAQLSFLGLWGLLPTMGAFILIFAGPHAELNRMILSNSLMVGIGKISYPMYLWHWPILVFGVARFDQAPSAIYQLACVVLSILLATVTFLNRKTDSL